MACTINDLLKAVDAFKYTQNPPKYDSTLAWIKSFYASRAELKKFCLDHDLNVIFPEEE